MKRLSSGLVLAFGLALASPAGAEVSAGNRSEAIAAFQAFDALVRQTRAQGALPRWSRPEHTAVLARLWNVKATLGAAPYRAADVSVLLDVLNGGSAVFRAYVQFAPRAGVQPDLAANAVAYQDEIVHATAYLTFVEAAILEAMTDFVATLPAAEMTDVRRAGLKQARLGIAQQLEGSAIILSDPSLRPDNRRRLLDALQTNAGRLGAALAPAERAQLVRKMQPSLARLSGAEREQAQAIILALAPPDCSGLCAVE